MLYAKPPTAMDTFQPIPWFFSNKCREQNYVTTGNGGLGWYVMWTRFRNDGNVPTHNVAGIRASSTRLDVFVNSYGLRRHQVTNKRCVGILKWKAFCVYVD